MWKATRTTTLLIQVELTTITPDDEVEQCWDMLRHKVSDACALLPDGASIPS